jgi:hypothetical protein
MEVAVDGLVRRLEDLLGRREIGHALGEIDAVVLVIDPVISRMTDSVKPCTRLEITTAPRRARWDPP